MCNSIEGVHGHCSVCAYGAREITLFGFFGTRTSRTGHPRPKGLRDDCWLRHVEDSMDDLKVKDNSEFRKEKAAEYGVGFELPSVVPNVPKIEEKDQAKKAA
jgi:hypothetical protein